MAMFSFDYYNEAEIPNIYLANPDGVPLYNLGTIYERKFELRYNTLSTFTFTAPSKINGETTDYYNSIQFRRIVCVENIGNFMITQIEISNNGTVEEKNVTCKSIETMLSYKKLSLFKGAFTFSGSATIGDAHSDNLMTSLLGYIKGWSLGWLDPDLVSETRYFDITDKTLYDFMMNDASQSYQCVFGFDTLTKTISASAISNISNKTDIYISFDNLMEAFTISESTEELATALTVLGGEDIDISYVNPLGTNVIYNFDYYKTTDWMTQDLIDALDAWEVKVADYQPSYASLVTGMSVAEADKLTHKSALDSLNNELAAATQAFNAAVTSGDTTLQAWASGSITQLNIEIADETILYNDAVATYNGIVTQMVNINNDLDFENPANFSEEQLSVLDNFIIGNTYTNVNFAYHDNMSEAEIQNEAQLLYNQARGIWDSDTQEYIGGVLGKVSQPRYTFEIESANFIFLKEYEPFISQLSLGSTITVELENGTTTEVILLGIDFNYDNPDEFKLVLSNRLRLDNDQFQYSDLFDSVVDAGTTTNFNSQKWNNFAASYSELVNSDSTFVVSSTTSSASNIAIFDGLSGGIIRDGGALYVSSAAFTPSLFSYGTTFSYSNQKGNYSVLGRMLFFEATIEVSGSSGTSTNQVYITLPPPIHKNSTGVTASFKPAWENVTLGTGYVGISGLLPSSGSYIALYKEGSAIPLSPIIGSSLRGSGATKFYLSGQYEID